jgi:hypothetical protein
MRLLTIVLLISLTTTLYAQTAATGIPYFQQHVHYRLNATFEDDARSPAIDGQGTLEYTNNSPDTLHELYFHLYWNLFTNGSYGETAPNRDHDPDSKYGHGGIDIKKIDLEYPGPVAGTPSSYDREYSVTVQNPKHEIDNTIMRVALDRELIPGGRVRIEFSWHGILPNYGIRSTWGWHDNGARNFSTAQWYPQVCVYDNHGWHADQYIGMGEFYTDYGEYDVTLTVPDRFKTIVTTGSLINAAEVLPVGAIQQLDFARSHPDSIVRVTDFSEYQPLPISKSAPTIIWKFHADSVRDFAWCADEAYIWDAVYDNGIMHSALYWNNSRDFWSKEAAKVELLTIQTNSKFAGQYRYPNIFMCETYEGGMEYPGIVYIGPYSNGTTFHWSQNTMMHELGHEWYPMMMGSNETDYGYMDEGFNTFITTFVHEKYFGRWNNSYGPGLGYNDDERTSNYRSAIVKQLEGDQEPSKQKADAFYTYSDYATATYPHTSSVFLMLRYTMGEKAFDDFMHLYYERWHFKHPYPDDLLNAAEDIERVEGDTNRVRARGDLRWFFNEWFEQTWKLDYAIEDFDVFHWNGANDGGGSGATVRIKRKERAVMPIDLVFTLADGTTQQEWIPVDDWLRTVAEERTYTFYHFRERPIHVEINPSLELLDVNRLNNSSSWLPPMQIDLIPKILGDVKPIDEYAIRSSPFALPLNADFNGGLSLGWTFRGGYLDKMDRIAIGPRYETANQEIGGVLQYHTQFNMFSPWSDLDIVLTHFKSSDLFGFRYSHVIDEPGTTDPIHILESGFDVSGPLFLDNGAAPLNRAYAGYTMHRESAINAFVVAVDLEEGLGDPRTTYTKLAGMIDDRIDLTSNWNAFIRLFGGSMQPTGSAIPSQTLFQLASSSDVDHRSDIYGSNFGMGVRDKIRNATTSGPLVRGYVGSGNEIGRVAASATLELGNRSLFPLNVLRMIPIAGSLFEPFGLTLFADAGLVTNAFCTCNYRDELKSDAGVGLRFFGFERHVDKALGLDADRMNMQIDFPIYLDKPSAGEEKLKFRVVGMIRQEF